MQTNRLHLNGAFQSCSDANSLTFQVSLSLWDTSEACGADYREEQVSKTFSWNIVQTFKHRWRWWPGQWETLPGSLNGRMLSYWWARIGVVEQRPRRMFHTTSKKQSKSPMQIRKGDQLCNLREAVNKTRLSDLPFLCCSPALFFRMEFEKLVFSSHGRCTPSPVKRALQRLDWLLTGLQTSPRSTTGVWLLLATRQTWKYTGSTKAKK